MRKQYQQGDVTLETIAKIPGGAKKLAHRTVAEGEATGHHHTFIEDTVELFERDGVLYVNAPEGGTLAHQEHGTVTVPPGTYRYRPVREYDPFEQHILRVAD